MVGRPGPPREPASPEEPTSTLLDRFVASVLSFAQAESAGGLVLLAATVAALVWANSPWSSTYTEVWQTPLAVGISDARLEKPLQLWVNDGLMAIFFLVVGLEIKRELRFGALASPRSAFLPIVAAGGGAIVPALVYLAFTAGTDAARGWGIAMATDIAFALGLLALLGPAVPVGLKVFVTALAIVDDILAVLVIGVVYTGELALEWLAIAGLIFGLLLVANRLGIERLAVYGILGGLLWLAVLQSGIHATIAGVAAAMTIPARPRQAVGGAAGDHPRVLPKEPLAPLDRLEHGLHPWTAFAIVPIFALANAGVAIGDHLDAALRHPAVHGIAAGLVIGKQVGILGAAWLAVRSGLADLPEDLTWRHLWGAGWVAGIGFTMSLFIAELAFPGLTLVEVAKLGILAASIVAAAGGTLILVRVAGQPRPAG